MKLTDPCAEAIIRLQAKCPQEYAILEEALKSYRHELFEFVMYAPSEDAETFRGMARGATEIIRALTSARQHLEKTRQRRQ